MKVVDEVERHRRHVLEKDDRDGQQARQEIEEPTVEMGGHVRPCSHGLLDLALRGDMARGRETGKQKDRPGEQGCHAIDPEQRAKRVEREKSPDRRSDAHSQVDRQPVQREGGFALVRANEVPEDRQVRGSEGLRDQRQRHRRGDDASEIPREREREKDCAGQHQRDPHDANRAIPIGQAARDGSGHQRGGAVEGHHEAGGGEGETKLPGQINREERQDHRSGLVDERGRGQHPDFPRKPSQSPPGIHSVPPLRPHGSLRVLRSAGPAVLSHERGGTDFRRDVAGAMRRRAQGGRALP